MKTEFYARFFLNSSEKKGIPVSFGESSSRAETAGKVAVQSVNFINQ
ncbi:hypothetical protein [Polaribacter glomeratus]|nr:hypothetical protein [Polaribacter glomeratus]